jgi:transcription elongation factor
MTAKIPGVYPWMWMQGPCSHISIKHYTPKRVRRLILLNAPVLPKKPMVIVSELTTVENVKALVAVAEEIISYIGHESTARLLSEILGVEVQVNRGEYEPQRGDIAVVVRLKRRLQTPQDIKNVTLEDLEFYVVSYEEDEVID